MFLFLFLFFAVLDDLCDNDDGNLATICEFRSELPSSNPVHLTLPGGTARLCRQAYSFSPCISLIFFYAFCSLFLLNFCLSIFFSNEKLINEKGRRNHPSIKRRTALSCHGLWLHMKRA